MGGWWGVNWALRGLVSLSVPSQTLSSVVEWIDIQLSSLFHHLLFPSLLHYSYPQLHKELHQANRPEVLAVSSSRYGYWVITSLSPNYNLDCSLHRKKRDQWDVPALYFSWWSKLKKLKPWCKLIGALWNWNTLQLWTRFKTKTRLLESGRSPECSDCILRFMEQQY